MDATLRECAWKFSAGGLVAGFLTGAISAAFSAGGPPTIIYTTLTGWQKHDIKATLSIFFFLGGIFTVIAHLAGGLLDLSVFRTFLLCSPGVLVGVWSGSLAYSRFNTEAYIRTVLVALSLMGLMMARSAVINW